MDLPDDAELVAILKRFGISAQAMLGHGAEAWVYAIDNERVLRVLHPGGQAQEVHRRQDLVVELARASSAFALTTVLEVGEIDGRVFAVERRLAGRSMMEELQTCQIATNLRQSTANFDSINAAAIAESLPSATDPAFVHLDAFAANMLTDGSRITAVIDIGPTSLSGDRRIDPLAAAVYLTSPQITPTAKSEDVDVAMSWLRAAGLDDWFAPAQRWLAAYWSTVEHPPVLGWCCDVLLRSD